MAKEYGISSVVNVPEVMKTLHDGKPSLSSSSTVRGSSRMKRLCPEIKEWDKRVHPKMAMEYLETYRPTCEYFYLAAKKFSKSTLDLKDIGLFDLTRMKVIKNPEYLYPDVEFRANLMKRE